MNQEQSPGADEGPQDAADNSLPPQFPQLANSSNKAAATFAEMIAQAEEQRGEVALTVFQQNLERAADYAHEWMLNDERSLALEKLAAFHLSQCHTREALKVLTRLSVHQAKAYGSEHPVLARTYMLIGQCHLKERDSFNAVRCLREAVVRYQCSDQLNLPDFVEALCQLSQVYREQNKPDLAKTAVKQALSVVTASNENESALLQARLLHEFGSLLYDTHQFPAAISVFRKAIGIKQDVLGELDFACANTLVALGMAYFSARDFEKAEQTLVQAALICELAKCSDRTYRAEVFYKLAGTLRVMGRLAESGMIEDAAKEVSGGQTQIWLYDQFRKDMEAGYAAEKADLWDQAANSYRQALKALESFRHRNSADRVAILIRLQMSAENRNQKVQATTLQIEIENELNELFGSRQIERPEAARQLARLFRIQGKNVAADAFLLYAEREYRRRRNHGALAILLPQRAILLAANKQPEEARKVEKLARRLASKLSPAEQNIAMTPDQPPDDGP